MGERMNIPAPCKHLVQINTCFIYAWVAIL